jgi:hypothetical protein
MIRPATPTLSELYAADETAWLDAHAELIRDGRYAEIDYPNLQEFLESMAGRDRREVTSRLVILLAHLLKYEFQPDRRTNSWAGTIVTQQRELIADAQSGVLRNHAEAVLPKAYWDAVKLAAAETQLPKSAFPAECPYTLEHLLTADLIPDPAGGAEDES